MLQDFSTEANERKVKEIALGLERLEKQYQHFLHELGLTHEQLTAYVENSDNFSPETLQELQETKQKLDEKLNLKLESISDPTKVAQKRNDQGQIQRNWIFVR